MRHDGDVYVHDYNYLSLEGVFTNWSLLTEQSEQGVFKEREVFDGGGGVIQSSWWHRAWIPFAEDGGGNLLCIDMAPEANGVVGQILKMELGAGPVVTQHVSFLAWLESYSNNLKRGVYAVDEDGHLSEKID